MKKYVFCFACFFPAIVQAGDCPGASSELSTITGQDLSSPVVEAKLSGIIGKCPELAEAHFQLGASYLKQNKLAEARKSFQKSVDLKREPLFLVALGNVMFLLKDFNSSSKAYEEALKKSPNNTKAMQGLSVIALTGGRRSEAEELLRKAIQITPEEAGLFYNLGLVLVESSRTEEAVESFRAALERKSPYNEANLQLGSLYLRLAKAQEAEKVFRTAALHDPKNPQVWIGLGAALDQLRDYSAAQSNFEKAITFEPKNATARLNLAIVKVKSGDVDSGLNLLRDLCAEQPNVADHHSALGWALMQKKQLAEAEKELQAALLIKPQDLFSMNNLGVVYQLMGESEKAKGIFEKARDYSSVNPGEQSGLRTEIETNLSALQ